MEAVNGGSDPNLVQLDRRMRLMATASAYDLSRPEERRRSVEDLIDLFHELHIVSKPEVFVEVGAYEARTSREIKASHPEMRVVAFEGNPENHRYFDSHHDFSSLGVEYVQALVSDADGFIEMQHQAIIAGAAAPSLRGNDSLLKRKRPDVEYEAQTLPSVRLDRFFSGADEATFSFWIDVEGAFEQVFKGGQKIFAKTKFLLIEVEDRAFWEGQWLLPDVQSALADLDFVPVARDFESPNQYNVLFAHARQLADGKVCRVLTSYLSRIALESPVAPPPRRRRFQGARSAKPYVVLRPTFDWPSSEAGERWKLVRRNGDAAALSMIKYAELWPQVSLMPAADFMARAREIAERTLRASGAELIGMEEIEDLRSDDIAIISDADDWLAPDIFERLRSHHRAELYIWGSLRLGLFNLGAQAQPQSDSVLSERPITSRAYANNYAVSGALIRAVGPEALSNQWNVNHMLRDGDVTPVVISDYSSLTNKHPCTKAYMVNNSFDDEASLRSGLRLFTTGLAEMQAKAVDDLQWLASPIAEMRELMIEAQAL